MSESNPTELDRDRSYRAHADVVRELHTHAGFTKYIGYKVNAKRGVKYGEGLHDEGIFKARLHRKRIKMRSQFKAAVKEEWIRFLLKDILYDVVIDDQDFSYLSAKRLIKNAE